MSGSPKYVSLELDRAREQEVARQAAAALAAARKKSEAEEARRKAKRLADKKAEALAISRACEASVTAVTRGEIAEFADQAAASRLEAALKAHASTLSGAMDIEALERAVREIRATETSAREIAEAAKRERLRRQRANVAQIVAGLAAAISEGDASAAARFDAAGRDSVASIHSRAAGELAKGRFDQAEKLVAEGHARLEVHRKSVAVSQAEWLARRGLAEESLRRLDDALTAARENSVLVRWRDTDLTALQSELEPLSRQLQVDDFGDIATRTGETQAKLQNLLAKAAEDEERDVRRRVILQAYREALEELDFIVEDLGLDAPADARSNCRLAARLRTGECLEVGVPLEGDASYRLEGFAMREEEEGDDGVLVYTCDEAQDHLSRIHAVLADRGFRTGALRWKGNPTRIRKNEKDLRARSEQSREKEA